MSERRKPQSGTRGMGGPESPWLGSAIRPQPDRTGEATAFEMIAAPKNPYTVADAGSLTGCSRQGPTLFPLSGTDGRFNVASFAQLGFNNYADYLSGVHWKRFKSAYRKCKLRPQTCLVCGDKDVDLHHQTYERLGRERFEDVVPLCRTHHEMVHANLDENGWPVEHTADALAAIRNRKPPKNKRRKTLFLIGDYGRKIAAEKRAAAIVGKERLALIGRIEDAKLEYQRIHGPDGHQRGKPLPKIETFLVRKKMP